MIKSDSVKLYSKDGKNSDIFLYLQELIKKNRELGIKAITNILKLPVKFELFDDIKVIKQGKTKFYELRVRSKNDICRFFFIIENPNFIVLLGFTKKTQKTEKKYLEKVIDIIEDYKNNKNTIDFDINNL